MNILLKEALEEENDLMKKIINKKTENLEEQNREVSKLLKQQSDFIAVAAHEFRTPLSIALFQIEDATDTYKNNDKIFNEMKVVQGSLNNLRVLTNSLFDTEKYDLEKIEVNKININILDFLKEIFFEAKNISLNNN
jgi:signal transduction histidine kinase